MITGDPTLMGWLLSKRYSEHTGQLPSMAFSRQVCELKSDSDMHALHCMQWKKSMPRPLPRLRVTKRQARFSCLWTRHFSAAISNHKQTLAVLRMD